MKSLQGFGLDFCLSLRVNADFRGPGRLFSPTEARGGCGVMTIVMQRVSHCLDR